MNCYYCLSSNPLRTIVAQCVLCGNSFGGKVYDAFPLTDGDCCDKCDFDKVIPARQQYWADRYGVTVEEYANMPQPNY